MRLNRRELIAAFLGSAALAGCRAGETNELPPGELVGAGEQLGHRLRSRTVPEIPENQWSDVDVLVIGGGVAGLSAARALRQAGIDDFLVLEIEPRIGGTSAGGESRGIKHPWGAHYLPAPTHENPPLVALLKEVDAFEGEDERGEPVVREELAVRAPEERVFHKGRWYEGLYLHAGASADDVRQLREFERQVDRLVSFRDGSGRRAFTLPVARCSTDSEILALDKMTASEWLARHKLTSPRLHWLIDYACRDDYGMAADHTSAWAALFYFAARKPNADQPSRPFVTWPEGNARLIRHLAGFCKDRIRLGWAVADVQPVGNGKDVRVEVRAINEVTAVGFRARRVIFAAPQFIAPYLIRPWRSSPPSPVRDFVYGSWMVANITLPRRPAEDVDHAPLAWDNVLYESPSLGYVSASYQARVDHGPEVWTYYFPLAGANVKSERQRLLQAGRDEWAEVLLADLEPAYPDLRTQAERIDVMRWGHAMIRPVPGFVSGAARRLAARPFRGIHFAHSDLSGVALFEEAFDQGNRAAREVIHALKN